MKQLNAAIIGYGLSGKVFHGPLLKVLPNYNVSHIITRDIEKQKQALSDFPNAQILESENELFESPEVDLVIICTPNVQHFPLARKALEAGKHVVVEKPFTVTENEAAFLIALAKKQHLKLAVYHNRRFDNDFKTLKEILQSNSLGDVVAFESRFDRYRPHLKGNSWREDPVPGAGLLYDLGSHLLDQALCLFGMPDELYADISSQRQGPVDDAFEINLYYPHLKVTLKASALIKEPTPRFAVYGKKGAFLKYGLDPQEEALRAGTLPKSTNWGIEEETFWGTLNTMDDRKAYPSLPGDYTEFYEKVYTAITEDKAPPVTGEDGQMVIRLIEAAIKSNHDKTRVVFEK